MTIHLIGYCREGFEPDLALEVKDLLKVLKTNISVKQGPGYIQTSSFSFDDAKFLNSTGVLASSMFGRQLLIAFPIAYAGEGDRVSPIISTVQNELLPMTFGQGFSDLWLEYPDTNSGKTLSRFAHKFKPILERALNKAKLLPKGPRAKHLARLHIFFPSYDEAWVAFAMPSPHAAWPMGIPRLKFPTDAPSRATLKLEEALWVFLTAEERQEYLLPQMVAVDLGAAPGGWTYQFVKRGMEVFAIDNAAMAQDLMATGLVTHVCADALTWLPQRPVDWLVADVVEQPQKMTRVIERWMSLNLARHFIFNLKLPMKKRYEAVLENLEILRYSVNQYQEYKLCAKQLYHDRKEITVYIGPSKFK